MSGMAAALRRRLMEELPGFGRFDRAEDAKSGKTSDGRGLGKARDARRGSPHGQGVDEGGHGYASDGQIEGVLGQRGSLVAFRIESGRGQATNGRKTVGESLRGGRGTLKYRCPATYARAASGASNAGGYGRVVRRQSMRKPGWNRLRQRTHWRGLAAGRRTCAVDRRARRPRRLPRGDLARRPPIRINCAGKPRGNSRLGQRGSLVAFRIESGEVRRQMDAKP